jgi:uncharacterized membrane protein YqiK
VSGPPVKVFPYVEPDDERERRRKAKAANAAAERARQRREAALDRAAAPNAPCRDHDPERTPSDELTIGQAQRLRAALVLPSRLRYWIGPKRGDDVGC